MLQKKSVSVRLPESLSNQLNQLIEAQSERCCGRVADMDSRNRMLKNFSWAKKLAERYFRSRIKRAEDLASESVRMAQKLANTYIGAGIMIFS